MLRAILAVIAGYITMFAFIFLTFTGTYLALGADGAFAPGTYDPSITWTIASIVLGTCAAFAGGVVCALIARKPRPMLALAVLVFVLGLVSAAATAFTPAVDHGPRPASVSNFEAMTKARTPLWQALLNPVLGVAGVLIAKGLMRSKLAKA